MILGVNKPFVVCYNNYTKTVKRGFIMSLEQKWTQHLKTLGVKLPKNNTNGRNVLEFMYKNIGCWCDKLQIVAAICYEGPDLQSMRHLSTGGWFVEQDGKGNYRLVTVTQTFPKWIPNKRKTKINVESWEALKSKYNNKCASCGSEEGKPHNHTLKITKLEKGHKDPEKDLTLNNMIPQCDYCNKRYKDTYKFDNYGIPIEIKLDIGQGPLWYKIPNYGKQKNEI